MAVCGGVRCVYELYESLVGGNDKTWDTYTALDHVYVNTHPRSRGVKHLRGAVGITDGLAACDEDSRAKLERESHFPFARLDKGLEFKCMEGQASVPADAVRIKAAIQKVGEGQKGSGSDRLDNAVHVRVAISALERAQEEGGERLVKYWNAVLQGEHREVRRVKLEGLLDTQEKADELVEALSRNSAHSLQLLQIKCEEATSLPERCPHRLQVCCDSPLLA